MLIGSTALAGLALPSSVRAATPQWLGTTSADWFTPSNWLPAAVPTAADDVTVDSTSPHSTAVNGGAAFSQQLFVGAIGTGNLAITNGGSLSTSSFGYLGYFANGAGVMTVDGAGSNWTNTAGLKIGYFGSGTLTITHGGTVTTIGQISIGTNAGASGRILVDGAGSGLGLNSNASFYVGDSGTGTLTITNGGSVVDANVFVGNSAGATGSVVVDGVGSSWITSNGLVVGYSGLGTLTISNGATATTSFAAIGGTTAGSGGSVSIDGAGSSWTLNTLYVGDNTTGSLAVTHGGSLTTNNTVIGVGLGSSGRVTIDGAGSFWTSLADISIGELGTGAVTIANGGAVSVGGQLLIAHQAGSNGALNIGAAPGSAATAPGTLSATSVQFGAGSGAINFNHTSSGYVFSVDITGAGAVNQLSGHTILTGNESYTGPTDVAGGTLSVNSSIASSSLTTVDTGGTLGGIGTVGNTLVNGGTLAPGNSIGTLTVSGSLTLTAASTYLVQVSGQSSDRTIVTGTANLAGKVVVDPLARVAATTTYTILSSAGSNGTFSAAQFLSANSFASNPRLSYAGNSVLLTLDPGFLSPNLPVNANINQRNVAAGIDNALNSGSTMPAGFNTLLALSGSPLLGALTQASGEPATGSQQATFDAMTLFMGVMTDPFTAGRSGAAPGATGFAEEGDARAYAADGRRRSAAERDAYAMVAKAPQRSFEARWNVWAAGYGGSQATDGNATLGANNATSRVGGVAVGADYWFSPNTITGVALAGGGTSFSVNGLGGGRSDLFQAGAFVRHTVGSAYITAAAAYGWQDITTDRTVTIAGFDRLHANFRANAWSGRVEGGNRYVSSWLGGVGVTPYAAAQVTAFDLPNYAETVAGGANTFALAYAAKTATSPRSELGLRSDKSYVVGDALLVLRGRAAWAHDYNTGRNVQATFQTLPGASFIVNGAAPAHDAALTTASAEMTFVSGVSLAATFEGEFSGVTRSYAGKGTARYQW